MNQDFNEVVDGLQKNLRPMVLKNTATMAFLVKGDELIINRESLSKYEIGKAFYNLGKIYYDKSDLVSAEENFICAYQCAEKPRDIFSILKILGFLIRIASEKIEDDKARTYIEEAERLVGVLTDSLGSLNSEYFYNLGVVNTYQGDFNKACFYYEMACKNAKAENRPAVLSKTLLALAVNAYNRKAFNASLEHINQLGNLLRVIKKDYLYGSMHFYHAKVLLELEMYEDALDLYRQANRILQKKKCWNLYGHILLDKGIVHKSRGDYEKALDFFHLARESIDDQVFCRLSERISNQIDEVNDSSVDLYIDKVKCQVKEKTLGVINFKHRFILLETLFLLAHQPGVYHNKEQLAKEIWGNEYNPLIHDKLIYTSVSRLRKLIEPFKDGKKYKYILRGKDGYTFNPMVNIRFHIEADKVQNQAIGNVDLGSPV